ncbi:hypothetical protein BDW62DRAFT_202904 [Aspergillus aurantiobrunneus]
MSFLKELTKEFKELKASLMGDGDKEKDKDKQKEKETEGRRAHDPGHVPEPSPAQYPPQSLNPQAGPPLPPGWVPGSTQSVSDGTISNRPLAFLTGSRLHTLPRTASIRLPTFLSQNPGTGPPVGGDYSHGEKFKDKDKNDKQKMLLGAAGGLAVAAVGGAVVKNALADDSDKSAPAASAPPPAGLPPDETADGDSVSSSDRESVLEARQEYEQATLAAQDSDASSSEEEALEEAREAYEEEYEETYED